MDLWETACARRDDLVVESTDLRLSRHARARSSKTAANPLPAGLVVEGLVTDAVALGKLLYRAARAHGWIASV
jgi:hypothetical protein